MSVIRPNPPFHPETLLLIEWEYADDGEFADEDENVLRETLLICREILEQWSLFVNGEFIHIILRVKTNSMRRVNL